MSKHLLKARIFKYPVFCAVLLLFVIGITSCSSKHEDNRRSFYYWETTFKLSAQEKSTLHNLGINQLYLRFFDVDIETAIGIPVPVSPIRFAEAIPKSLAIVPVVFITNRTFLSTPDSAIKPLQFRVLRLIQAIAERQGIKMKEVQMDCDWTEKSRSKYFSFLREMRQQLAMDSIKLSATIRLHQIKYYQRTGLPPVDRGMLMFYNMGKLQATATRNSIYNNEDASRYASYITKYPLPLDCALPVFGWAVHIRGQKIVGLLDRSITGDIPNNHKFRSVGKNVFVCDSSGFLHGAYFIKNDVIKYEIVDPVLSLQAAKKAAENLSPAQRSIALFDLDSLTIATYHEKDFTALFRTFR